MKILFGINDNAVIQRRGENSCLCHIIGESDLNTPISITVIDSEAKRIKSAALESLIFKSLENNAYHFECQLVGIPTGGPYAITLEQDKKIEFFDVYVGDLYVLAGQSNMEGVGKLKDKVEPHPLTRAFYMDDHWDVALDPINDFTTAIDDIHRHLNGGSFEPKNQTTGTGLGVSFGQSLNRLMHVPIGLIPCAHGGTNMDQWSPNYADNNGYGLYQMMLTRIKKSGGFISGLLWYQGCSDTNPSDSMAYFEKMKYWIASIRQDIDSQLPIVMAQISKQCSHESDAFSWNTVQEQQYRLCQTLPNLQLVSTIDLEMDDFIHISGKSQRRLGVRFADAMHYLQTGFGKPTPTLKSIVLERDASSWNYNIRLTYDFVNNHLMSNGSPYGFSLTDIYTGEEKHYIYHTQLEGNQILLKTTESALALKNCVLNYGKGFMPYCNIVDKADRALPALYHIKLGESRRLTSPCKQAWISHEKTFPEARCGESILNGLSQYTFKDFWFYFLNSHLFEAETIMYHIPFEIGEIGVNEGRLIESELLIGGYGEFEIYIDALLIQKVTLSKNIAPDQHILPLKLTPGEHLLSVWYRPYDYPKGIFVRFDLTKSQVSFKWL